MLHTVLKRTSVVAGVVLFVVAAAPASAMPHSLQATIDTTGAGIINERLRFLWGQYINMVELLVTLITGTIALSVGFVKFDQDHPIAERGFFKLAMIFLSVALVCAICWRILAQLSMEEEVFGNPVLVRAYYANQGIVAPFTTSFTYSGESGLNNIIRSFSVALMALTAVGLVGGLGLLGAFAFANLPEGDRPPQPKSSSAGTQSDKKSLKPIAG